MKWWALAALLIYPACGEPAEERDPECEAQADSAWACSRERSATRSRCVAGRYEEDTCAAGTWCLPTVAAGGACLDKQLDSACPNDGAGPCPNGMECWGRICREACDPSGEVACTVVGQECYSISPIDEPGQRLACVWPEDKP